jgi:elongation factor Ts
MEITASAVKELRERTGAGMMDCKKALSTTSGDMEAAVDLLRTQGLAKVDKKASRIAAEGRIAQAAAGNSVLLLELNCETDFVAKDENFVKFANDVANVAAAAGATDVEAIKGLSVGGDTVEAARAALVAKIGENIQIRRAFKVSGPVVGAYLHGSRIGVAVALEGGNVDLARGIAMHVAAMNPQWKDMSEVPADVQQREKEIALEQMNADPKDMNKPADIKEKIVAGKIRKTLATQTLLGQEFASADANGALVEEVLKKANAKVLNFTRVVVGEGIEKKQEDFAAEVMAQVAASSS